MNWNWDHLRFFLALAAHGTLSEAARELGVSHSTVLRRIRAFEAELETHLFDHTRRGYQLTTAGRTLHSEVHKMKLTVDNISRQIAGADQAMAGPIVLTTTDTLGYHVMPTLIHQLQCRYPDLEITLNISNQLTDLSNREADIAIRTSLNPPPQLIGRRIGLVRFQACAAVSYLRQRPIGDFSVTRVDHRFITFDDRYRDTPFYQWLEQRVDQQSQRTAVNGLMTAHALCRAGLGITVLPLYLVERDPLLQALPMEESSIATNELWLLTHADLRDTLRIRAVRKFLFEALRQVFTD